MMYAIYNLTDNTIFRYFDSLPKSLSVGRRRVISPVSVGDEGTVNGKNYRFVELVRVGWTAPGDYYTQGVDTPVLSGNTLTITRSWTAWTQAEIDAYLAAENDAEVTRIMNQRQTRALYAIVNEIRVLKGQAALSQAQFRAWFAGLT